MTPLSSIPDAFNELDGRGHTRAWLLFLKARRSLGWSSVRKEGRRKGRELERHQVFVEKKNRKKKHFPVDLESSLIVYSSPKQNPLFLCLVS